MHLDVDHEAAENRVKNQNLNVSADMSSLEYELIR